MLTQDFIYHHDEQKLLGFLARDPLVDKPQPAVLVVHDWSGRNDFACQKATYLCELGYIGFAVDMYGQAKVGQTSEEKMGLIQPFKQDRAFLGARIASAFKALAAMPEVDETRIAAVGFCFGGLCVLDLARQGTAIKGAVSFHGLLNRPENLAPAAIQAKILVLHGYDDPMVKPEDVDAFCREMTLAGADWQVHQYGHTQHSFTNPQAHDAQLGTVFNAVAEKRSMHSMRNFLEEIL